MNKAYQIFKNAFAVIGIISCFYIALDFLVLSKPVFNPDEVNKEVFRIPSPKRAYEIVVVKYEPMSFSTPVYSTFIVPFGEKYSSKSNFFKFENFKSVSLSKDDIVWKNEKEIIIKRHSTSRVYNFDPDYYDPRDHKEGKDIKDYRKIEIELINY